MTSNGPKQTALAASLACNGYAFLPSWLPEEPSSALAQSTGRQLNFADKDPVQRLAPKATAGHNNYSGIFGLGAFPFHSDLAHWPVPPRYLMLRCIKGYGDVSTDLVDSMALVEGVGASDLSRALVKPRRPLDGALPLMSLFRPKSSRYAALFRWDEVFLVPASPAGGLGMKLVSDALASANRTSIVLKNPGDTLWIDNWRMLHGRSAVVATETDRLIDRIYFGEVV